MEALMFVMEACSKTLTYEISWGLTLTSVGPRFPDCNFIVKNELSFLLKAEL